MDATDTLEGPGAEEAPLPRGLVVVAWLFILNGIVSGFEIVLAALDGRVNLSLGVIGIFVGRGLIRLRPGWRTCALVMLWAGFLVLIGAALTLLSGGPRPGALFRGPAWVHRDWQLPYLIAVFAVAVWEYRVLVREDVRALFGLPPRDG